MIIARVRRSRKAGSDSEEEYRGRGRGFSHEEDLDEAMQVGTALLALHSQSHSFSREKHLLAAQNCCQEKGCDQNRQLTQCDW